MALYKSSYYYVTQIHILVCLYASYEFYYISIFQLLIINSESKGCDVGLIKMAWKFILVKLHFKMNASFDFCFHV